MAQKAKTEKPEQKADVKPKKPREAAFSLKASADLLKTVMNTIAMVTEEASFTVTPEAMAFRAMDPSHVVLVDMELPKDVFDSYECTQPGKITVRVEDLQKLVRRADSKDTVEIATAKEDVIEIRMSNGYTREYTIHRLESLRGETPLSKLTYDTEMVMAERGFVNVLRDVAVVSGGVTITANRGGVLFSGKGDSGSGLAALEKGHPDLLELKVKEESRATYSIDYLLGILKALPVDSVLIEYSSKKPIRLTFKLCEKGGRVQFYAAPHIEEK